MRMLRRLGRAADGFTLVEMTVVVGIIAVLAALTLPAVSGVTTSTRDTSKSGDIKAVEQAATRYESDNPGSFAITETTAPSTLVSDSNADGFIRIKVVSGDATGGTATDVSDASVAIDVVCTASLLSDAVNLCFGTVDFTKIVPGYLTSPPEHASGTPAELTATSTTGTGVGTATTNTADYTIPDCNLADDDCVFYLDQGVSIVAGSGTTGLLVWNLNKSNSVIILKENAQYGK